MASHKTNDEEPSVPCSDKKENCDETSVYEDSYILEYWLDDTEYMVPSSENTKLWQSTSESDKSELNMIQIIPIQFSLRLPMIETQTNLDILPPQIMWGCGMTEMSYIIKHLENATNSTMPLTA